MKRAGGVVLFVLVGLGGLMAAPAVACESAGPDTHVGVVTGVDTAKNTVTLKDAETGAKLTFMTRPELLKGVRVNDQIVVGFAEDGQTLRATSIRQSTDQ